MGLNHLLSQITKRGILNGHYPWLMRFEVDRAICQDLQNNIDDAATQKDISSDCFVMYLRARALRRKAKNPAWITN